LSRPLGFALFLFLSFGCNALADTSYTRFILPLCFMFRSSASIVSSFPLYTLLAYFRLSQTQTSTSSSDPAYGAGLRGPLSHLKWRILDTDQDQLGRALVYVVLSWWVIDVAR
jgi:hypothetical protein